MIPRITITNDLKPANANATHNLFGIRIRPASALPYQAAILKQELYEWWLLRKVGLLCTLPIFAGAAYLAANGANPVLCVSIALMLAFALQVGVLDIFGPFKRRMELTSHAIEYIWAIEKQGADAESYIAGEVRSLARYPKFQSWTPDELRAGMKARESAARKWLRGQS
jgi:hypothetical protein